MENLREEFEKEFGIDVFGGSVDVSDIANWWLAKLAEAEKEGYHKGFQEGSASWKIEEVEKEGMRKILSEIPNGYPGGKDDLRKFKQSLKDKYKL